MKNPDRRIIIERTYRADVADLWALWTTPDGIESWWGPDGFTTHVLELDLRPGGDLRYEMTATGADQIAFMKNAQMPLTTPARLTYTEIAPNERLSYTHLADFIPGVQPYDVATLVEFRPSGPHVRMILTFDPMHDEEWTQRMTAGHESQLGKLEAVIAKLLSSRA